MQQQTISALSTVSAIAAAVTQLIAWLCADYRTALLALFFLWVGFFLSKKSSLHLKFNIKKTSSSNLRPSLPAKPDPPKGVGRRGSIIYEQSPGAVESKPKLEDDLVSSIAIGAVTDSAVIGAVLGGSITGGFLGEALADTMSDTPPS